MVNSRINIDYIQLCKAIEEKDQSTAQSVILNNSDVNNLKRSDLNHLRRILSKISKMCNVFFHEIDTILDTNSMDENNKTTPQVITLDDVGNDDESIDDNDNILNDAKAICSKYATLICKAMNIVQKQLDLAELHAIHLDISKILNYAIQTNNTLGACLLIRRRALDKNFNELLLKAIKYKNDIIVEMLIYHGIQNNPSIDLKSFLNPAIFHGQLKMVKYIIPRCRFSKLSDKYIPREAVTGFGQQYKDCVNYLLELNFTVNPDSNKDEDFIYAAVRKGYLLIVLQLLKFKIDVNLINPKTGLSLVKVACLNKHHGIVEILLKHNASINVTTPTNTEKLDNLLINHHNYPFLFIYNHRDLCDITCLHIAVLNSDLIMTKLLLSYGATIIDDPQFFNIACIAIRYNCEEIVRLFLDHGLEVTYIDLQGKTLLHHCVSSLSTKQDLRYKIAELLLERGAGIHIQSPGNTLIFDAIKNGYRKIIQLFLDYDANIQFINSHGNTSLHQAIENNFDVDLIKTLLKHGSPVNIINHHKLTPLLVACKVRSENQLEIIKALFHYNADVNCADSSLMTALHYACQVQNLKLVKLLLEKGANPNARNDKGQTPLHIVYGPDDFYFQTLNYHNVLPITQLLLQHKANIEAVDVKGQTPLFRACATLCEEAVDYLLDHHANTNHTDLENLSPLYAAVKNYCAGNLTTIEILLKHKAKVYCKDRSGNSIIHRMVETETENFLESLACGQINFNSINKNGNTPLHFAIKKKSIVIIESLIKYGANVNILNKENRTPFRKAIDFMNYHKKKLEHKFIRKWSNSKQLNGNIDWLQYMYSCLNIDPYKNIIRILKLYIFKLKTAGLYVNKQNFNLFHNSNNYDANDNEYSDDDFDTEDFKTGIL